MTSTPTPNAHGPVADAWTRRLLAAASILGTAAGVIAYAVISRWPRFVDTNLFTLVGFLGSLSGLLVIAAEVRLALHNTQGGDS